jgi:hypothetical protein
MNRLLWIGYQAAVGIAVYSALTAAHPDIARSAIALTAGFAAFVATALPVALYDLALRLLVHRRASQ